MYTRAKSLPSLYIRNIISDDMNIPLLGYRALSGWGYTDFHASVNFAFWAFCEVRRRFLGALSYFVPWRTYTALRQEYAAFVAWPALTPREGAGQLPVLLLDQGQLPCSTHAQALRRCEKGIPVVRRGRKA